MSKAMSSPTARMLRSSRLFSMPPPLAQPSMEFAGAQGLSSRTSDTATRPYPSLQAIVSPASSRHRGDWGLKRPLPEKTNKPVLPVVRINALDTIEHITDFDSALDHTESLRKWQEMRIPMTQAERGLQEGSFVREGAPSAFDEIFDNTAMSVPHPSNPGAAKYVEAPRATADRALHNRSSMAAQGALSLSDTAGSNPRPSEQLRLRWKTDGPYLPSLSEDEFNQYLKRQIAKPGVRQEFNEFLLAVRKQQKRSEIQDEMTERQGFDANSEEDVAELDRLASISSPDTELKELTLVLRDEPHTLTSELSRHIQEFFDLPAFPRKDTSDALEQIQKITRMNPNERSAPTATHPSAGLSYIRTGAFMNNHPVHGPQERHSPLPARVLRPRDTMQGSLEHAYIGVGGFVAKDMTTGNSHHTNDERTQLGMSWNFDIPGGNKIWVTPSRAYVDEKGKVRMKLKYPDKQDIAVRTTGPDPRPALPDIDDSSYIANLKRSAHTNPLDIREPDGDVTRGIKTAPRARGLSEDEMRGFKERLKSVQNSRSRKLDEGVLGMLGAQR